MSVAIAGALIGAVAGVLYVIVGASIKPDDGRPAPLSQAAVERFAKGGLAKLETPPAPRPVPTAALTGPDGAAATLGGSGPVRVVNLWATWCAPCVTEMPSLARLQQAYPGGEVSVIPVSVDGANKLEAAKAFIAKNAPLPFHHSADAALAWAMESKSFPTTVILDKRGQERARLSAPAEWDTPEVKALLDRLAAEPA